MPWSDWQSAVEFSEVVSAENFHRTTYSQPISRPGTDLASAVADALAGTRAGVGWDGSNSGGGRDFTVEVEHWTSSSDPTSGNNVAATFQLGYNAATYRASTPTAPTIPVPSNAGPIPTDQITGTEIGLAQLEYGFSFTGWADAIFDNVVEINYAADTWDPQNWTWGPGFEPTGPPAWTPPAAYPITVGVTGPMSPTAPQLYFWSGNDPRWWRRGPKVLWADLEVLTETSFNSRHASATPPYSNYAVNGGNETLTDVHSITVPLSQVTQQEFALVFMDGYLNPARSFPPMPLGMPAERVGFYGWHHATSPPPPLSDGQVDYGHQIFGPPMLNERTAGFGNLIARWSTGRWRYWIPAATGGYWGVRMTS